MQTRLLILGVGAVGHIPESYPYYKMTLNRTEASSKLTLPVLLKRERKIRVITEAANYALDSIKTDPGLLSQCGFILTTQYDGRLGVMTEENSGQLISFADLSPSSVALSLVPNVAASCVPILMGLQGPSLSIASKKGLAAAIDLAALYLRQGAEIMLAQEYDLALPVNLREAGYEPAGDFSVGLVLALKDWGNPILGEIII